MPDRHLIGYVNAWSVAAGDAIDVIVSSSESSYEADLVRLRHGDGRPGAPGLKERVVAGLRAGQPGRVQPTWPGSCITVPVNSEVAQLHDFSVALWVWPTTPALERVQGLVSTLDEGGAGWALVLDGRGRVGVVLADATTVEHVFHDVPLRERTWHFVGISYESSEATTRLFVWPIDSKDRLVSHQRRVRPSVRPPASDRWLLAVAQRDRKGGGPCRSTGHLNGKLDRPAIFARALGTVEMRALASGRTAAEVGKSALLAAWDLGREPDSTRVLDLGPRQLHGTTVNSPTRAVTGHNWSAGCLDFSQSPQTYGAIHFHDDDLDSADWEPDFTCTLPQDAPSGVYAIRLRAGSLEDRIPLFVRRPANTPVASVALLLPTFTYLAYANSRSLHRREVTAAGVLGRRPAPHRLDTWLAGHPELGLSVYDRHSDGSGCCHSSRLRPIVSLRPDHVSWTTGAPRHLGADLYIVDWLEEEGTRFDVITDEDLHVAGVELLRPYRAVITGTHPEYATAPMLDALDAFLSAGGRLLCLGGNGFYGVTSVPSDRRHVIEVRRGHAGTRPWESEPGEVHHASTGEAGGLWRHRGRPPNALLGAGFGAQGWDYRASGYVRAADSFSPRASWIFEGVGQEEVIGDFGLVMGGAAGDELDRADPALGTPDGTMVLASSSGHSDYYRVAVEDVLTMGPGLTGSTDPRVRADLVYRETAGGGAVFSASSICWAGSLSHNGYDNNVARVTRNVLRGFLGAALPTQS
jgi:N,N-dimethylformamidase